MKQALVTGGAGFLGCNVSEALIRAGYEVWIIDDLSRVGSRENLNVLSTLGGIHFIQWDITDRNKNHALLRRISPDVLVHLAGQVAMAKSIQYPVADFSVNTAATVHLLDSIRVLGLKTIFLLSSSNKVYGQIGAIPKAMRKYGIPETMPLRFQTPYGCSKGAADQYALDYASSFGLRTVVFRHSALYGPRQYPTVDQGWIGWFCKQATEAKLDPDRPPFTINGTGRQVRDVLYVTDAVDAYLAAIDQIDQCAGQAFNIGGGVANALSILGLLRCLERLLKVKLQFTHLPMRHADQMWFVCDIRKAKKWFGWAPKVPKEDGIRKMVEWCASISGNDSASLR